MERGPVIPGVQGEQMPGAVRDGHRRKEIYKAREAIGRCDRKKVEYTDSDGKKAEMTTAEGG